MITTINGIEYTIRINNGENIEIERDEPTTGLRKVFVFDFLGIGQPTTKRIQTTYSSYDIAPTGTRINKQLHQYTSSESDYESFEQELVGFVLKRSIVNGMFRFIDQTANAVFDSNGDIIPIINN